MVWGCGSWAEGELLREGGWDGGFFRLYIIGFWKGEREGKMRAWLGGASISGRFSVFVFLSKGGERERESGRAGERAVCAGGVPISCIWC